MNNELILNIFKSTYKKDAPKISLLANTASILKDLDKVSWAGFYLVDGDELILGPFQGSIACVRIAKGMGVCGTSFLKKETIIVENVHEFPTHIACSASSNSEIVTPIIKDGKVVGVIDLDSDEYSAFDNDTKKLLEQIADYLKEAF